MSITGTSLGRVTSTALVFAGIWSVLIILGGFLLPIYASESRSDPGLVVHGPRTVVGVNGPVAIVVICVPAVATLLVRAALELWSRRGLRGGVAVAWLVVALLAVFAVLTVVSIGFAVVPVVAALLVAVRGRRAPRTAPTAGAAP